MTRRQVPSVFKPKKGWIDRAPLLSSPQAVGGEVREVEILSAPDEYDYIQVRPIGSTPIHVHRKWLRDNPRKGY